MKTKTFSFNISIFKGRKYWTVYVYSDKDITIPQKEFRSIFLDVALAGAAIYIQEMTDELTTNS